MHDGGNARGGHGGGVGGGRANDPPKYILHAVTIGRLAKRDDREVDGAAATRPATAVNIIAIAPDATSGERNFPIAQRNADDDVLCNDSKNFHFPHRHSWRWSWWTAWRAERGGCVGDRRVRWVAVD